MSQQPKFNIGEYVVYKTKRLTGVVAAVFPEDDSPTPNYRYYVNTRYHTWSVPEQALELSKLAEIIPMIPRSENTQNDPNDAA